MKSRPKKEKRHKKRKKANNLEFPVTKTSSMIILHLDPSSVLDMKVIKAATEEKLQKIMKSQAECQKVLKTFKKGSEEEYLVRRKLAKLSSKREKVIMTYYLYIDNYGLVMDNYDLFYFMDNYFKL